MYFKVSWSFYGSAELTRARLLQESSSEEESSEDEAPPAAVAVKAKKVLAEGF